jgi:hypothetical protein
LGELQIDLISQRLPEENGPVEVARRLAAEKFADQLKKAGVSLAEIRSAQVSLRRSSLPKHGTMNGHPCVGYDLYFDAEVLTNRGNHYERELKIFVAPHDPRMERRSARAV